MSQGIIINILSSSVSSTEIFTNINEITTGSFSPGDILYRQETGVLYPDYNPSGFITSSLAGVGLINNLAGVLNLTGLGGVTVTTGSAGLINISGANTSVNLSGYVTSGSADSRYYSILNPSGYITGLNTGNFIIINQTGGFYPNYNPNQFSTSGNLTQTGINLLNLINPEIAGPRVTGISINGSTQILTGGVVLVGGTDIFLGQGPGTITIVSTAASKIVTGLTVTGGAALTGNINLIGSYGIQTISLGKNIYISGSVNKFTGYLGDGNSSGIIINSPLNNNYICWSLQETGGNREFVYPTSYISGNSLVFSFASGNVPTTNNYVLTLIG